MWRTAVALILAMTSPLSFADPPVEPGVSLKLAEQRAAVLSAVRYELHLTIPPQRDSAIPGQVGIEFDYQPDGNALQLDFTPGADHLNEVTVNGQALDVDYRREHMVIPAGSLREGRNRIAIRFTAGDLSLNRKDDYLYTLFVPDRARTAFPLFDQPDLKATISLSLDLPSDWVGLSNAPLLEQQKSTDHTRWQFAETEPISSYLFSFVAGKFEQVTREVAGRPMTLLHRETDADKVARNLDAIFELHGRALAWMESYTGIPLPYRKLDFALVPAFQYGGMEHTGAIQYRDSSLFLEADPTQTQQLSRASLIAHEVAHMWFGNLVTMKWFDDVWTKEVFANFMAAKMINPSFPKLDHELNFLIRHYPSAYGVDRTPGANPIRQPLANLNLAGQMYGPIIYQKAPIMMRQLELILGEEKLREGLRDYLRTFAHGNATWPELVAILDKQTDRNLVAWSEVWVNTPGRPNFQLSDSPSGSDLRQADPSGAGRVWPQRFSLRGAGAEVLLVDSVKAQVAVDVKGALPLFNSDGLGYGLFPANLEQLQLWPSLSDLERGSLLVNLYENMLEGRVAPGPYLSALLKVIQDRPDALLLDLALTQLYQTHTSLLPEPEREASLVEVEAILWQALDQDQGNRRRLYEAYSELAASEQALQRLRDLRSGELAMAGLTLSERDRIRLTEVLAIRMPDHADALIALQLREVKNPDQLARLRFIVPSLAGDPNVRDRFFASLAEEEQRQTERWVLDALGNLHHPSRRHHSVKYLPAALDLLEEIQVTGDIFFPAGWLEANFGNHNSPAAAKTAESFLAQRADYNPQLAMKIRQAADLPTRAAEMLYPAD